MTEDGSEEIFDPFYTPAVRCNTITCYWRSLPEHTKVDIEDDPTLRQRYGLHLSIVVDQDRGICAGTCDPGAVEAYLAAD